MALPVEILRAKAAVLYKPPESSEESQVQPEPKPIVLLDQLSVIEDIIDCQEKLNRLKIKTDRQKLQEEWSNPLGTDLVEALKRLVTTQFSFTFISSFFILSLVSLLNLIRFSLGS